MGRITDVTNVSTVGTCTSAGSASTLMDSAPCCFIWTWLAGTTGTASAGQAGTTTGTTSGTQGTASPSPVAWKENDINISFSRHGSEVLTPPLLLSTTNNSSELVSSLASSSSFASSASGPGSAQHNFNFLILDADQQEQPLPRCQTPSSTTSNTTNHNLNITAANTAYTSRSATAFNSFLCSPSTLGSDAAIEDENHTFGTHDSCSSIRQRSRTSKMPSSTLPPPDEPRFPSSTYSAANVPANTSQWRPHTSRSGRSARSASPLFARWARRHHHQLDVQESNDSRSSTDRKSTSSSGNPKSLLQHHQHHHDHSRHNNDDASHKHTHNVSTSTITRSSSSSRRPSQSGLPPPLTREEFEALPLAIQRKVCAVFRSSVTFALALFLPTELTLPNWPGVSGH
ncbi:hypothetical protein CONLIGDRAFT_54137 [Coniochaeta ligniaria NRRL 30616]|uniref:Uncharacterized protein n=1 Tax=Coniochaeta ligniaria NRRL 30616 TaxID=1408157 RepID=A0A1J7J7K6_9PEZI|nr:hypothetical protein CONLIGDRAFT_54137 [Coniochaeta ligniaria NRRL 30616]